MNFNEESKKWDNELRMKRALKISEEIMKEIPKDLCGNALEFGCGTGLISFNLKDRFNKITLVDLSEGMIKQLNEKIASAKVENMEAIVVDINQNMNLLNKYDIIYTSMALHHIVDIKTTLENLYKLLNKDGMLCLVDLDIDDGSFHKEEKDFKGHNGFLQRELKSLLEGIGFDIVNSHTFYKDVKSVAGEKIDYSLFLMTGRK